MKALIDTLNAFSVSVRKTLPSPFKFLFSRTMNIIYEQDLADLPTREIETQVQVDFRLLSTDDIAGYVDQIIHERRFVTKEKISKRLQEGQICLVAKLSDGSIIGHIWAAFDEMYLPETDRRMKLGPEEAYIYDGFVLRKYRRKNVNEKNLLTMCQYLRGKNVRKVYSATLSWNFAPRRALAGVGFREKGNVTLVRLLWMKRHTEQWNSHPPLFAS